MYIDIRSGKIAGLFGRNSKNQQRILMSGFADIAAIVDTKNCVRALAGGISPGLSGQKISS